MNPALDALYEQQVRARGKMPRFRRPPGPGVVTAVGDNPLCGDRIALAWCPATGALSFEGRACLLCVASADLACEHAAGRLPRAHAEAFLAALASGDFGALPPALGTFAAARDVPVRLGCVRLPWETLLRIDASSAPLAAGGLL